MSCARDLSEMDTTRERNRAARPFRTRQLHHGAALRSPTPATLADKQAQAAGHLARGMINFRLDDAVV